MKPKEYIETLTASANNRIYTEYDIPPAVVSTCQALGFKLTDLLDQINEQNWAEFLLSYLKPRLHPTITSLLDSDSIAIGTIVHPLPNASITSLKDGYAILFSTGMREFVYRLARIMATRFASAEDAVEMELHETARLVAEVFWWFQETKTAFGPNYEINNAQIQIANKLAMEAEAFLLCHEIGHIASDTPGMLEALSDDIHGVELAAHLDEFIADFFGAVLVLGTQDDERSLIDPLDLQFRYAGIEFALQIYQCLEKVGIEFSQSHPPAAERLSYIRNAIRRRCTDNESWISLSAIAVGIESIFDNILAILDSPQEHIRYFELMAKELLDDLDQALKECSGGMVPDYVEFHSRAGKIFDQGYPEQVMERVAQTAAAFYSDIQTESQNYTGEDSERWVRFQQFKLLLSFAQNLPQGPIRTRFMDTLGWSEE